MVRYVPEKLWTSIVTFYPKAIALKKTKGQEQEWIRCHQCKNKKRKFDELRNWARLATSVLPQKVLQKRWKHLPQQLDELHLVHSNDMKRLWNFVKLITKKKSSRYIYIEHFFHIKFQREAHQTQHQGKNLRKDHKRVGGVASHVFRSQARNESFSVPSQKFSEFKISHCFLGIYHVCYITLQRRVSKLRECGSQTL
mmetsp:Transcript_8248/g.9399  ORF Transcript_8248/g.9399 Transcript_8248/m.9399 type:complete len:197 (-) Transcript_8248:1465-2055(-)